MPPDPRNAISERHKEAARHGPYPEARLEPDFSGASDAAHPANTDYAGWAAERLSPTERALPPTALGAFGIELSRLR